MNKNKRKILNPKYRFSKFNNKWEYCELGSIANKVTKKNTLGKITRVLTNSASEGIVDQGDYFERTIVNQNNIKNYFIIKHGDFVYNPRISSIAPVGPISRNNIGDGIISPLYTVFRFNNKNNNFYEQYYKTSLWHKYLKEISNQGARFDRMSILDEDFFNMPIPYNKDSEELQEIANSIISIDNLILLEEEKLEELKSHKNGLLQKLFIRNDDVYPQLRFPKFNGKLKKIAIRNICDYSTSSLSMRDINPDGKYKLYDANKFIGNTDSCASKKSYITIIKDGAGVGRIRLLEGYTNFVGTMGMIKNKTNCTISFLYYLLNTINFNKYIVGGAIPHIYFKDYSLQDVIIPEQKQEQQKIADCISSIDDLISAQTEKIEALMQHKKGLLQGLFPSIKEVENE